MAPATATPPHPTASAAARRAGAGRTGRRRERTLALVAISSEEELERVHSPIMSPLVWDLGHIAAYEDLWLAHRHGGHGAAAPRPGRAV